MFKSPKTTVAGIAAILTALGIAITALTDADPATMPDWNTVVAAVVGLGLVLSRDNDVSSEDAGVDR